MIDKDHPTDPDAVTIDETADTSDGDSGLTNWWFGDKPSKDNLLEPVNTSSMGMPSQIGKYKIISVIGQGGMGCVFEAMQESPRRRVALKVIKPGSTSKMALRRFEFEAQTLAKLQHPNIAQIYESGTWDSPNGNVPFFAMEYIQGNRTLLEYARGKKLSTSDCLNLFDKVCNAVHHGHQKGVIHRDLKPDNILVSKNGEPKIIDFGVARATDADMAVATMQTTMGQLVGTLQYMSPEQCDADPDLIDIRSDVYSLGIILFQLLSGKLPYNLHRQAIHEAVRVIKEERPDSMGTISTNLRGDIDTITSKALEKDCEMRYQSASELANDINRYLNNEPIIARPASISYQLKMFIKKYKRTCIAMFLLTFSVVLGTIGTTLGWAEAARQLDRVNTRNEALNQSVTSLLEVVVGVVDKLGDSAEAQRQLLEIAKETMLAIQIDQDPTPEEQIQVAKLLLKNAHSHMSVSGVGFGDLDLAEQSLAESKEVLKSIEIDSNDKPNLALGLMFLELSRYKHLAELAQTKAESLTGDARDSKYKEAIALWSERDSMAKKYYEATNDSRFLTRQWSSAQGIGNAYIELEDFESAKNAGNLGLEYLTHIESLETETSLRTKRNIAVTHFLLAQASDAAESISHLQISIPISRELVALESDNARRPRDLALMLSLRGAERIGNGIDAEQGLQDFTESVDLLTVRALKSPRETASRVDFKREVANISMTLINADMFTEAEMICNGAIDQMECVANAGSLEGDDTWDFIISELRQTINK
ncbi:MAG: serine/threonine protein kinase [Phycisphaerae bacterium]|nr:serine/threonine protein kinase [Phycisphaerae bacterium]